VGSAPGSWAEVVEVGADSARISSRILEQTLRNGLTVLNARWLSSRRCRSSRNRSTAIWSGVGGRRRARAMVEAQVSAVARAHSRSLLADPHPVATTAHPTAAAAMITREWRPACTPATVVGTPKRSRLVLGFVPDSISSSCAKPLWQKRHRDNRCPCAPPGSRGDLTATTEPGAPPACRPNGQQTCGASA